MRLVGAIGMKDEARGCYRYDQTDEVPDHRVNHEKYEVHEGCKSCDEQHGADMQ